MDAGYRKKVPAAIGYGRDFVADQVAIAHREPSDKAAARWW